MPHTRHFLGSAAQRSRRSGTYRAAGRPDRPKRFPTDEALVQQEVPILAKSLQDRAHERFPRMLAGGTALAHFRS